MNDVSTTAAEAESRPATESHAAAPATTAPKPREFRWYMLGYAAFFVGMGLNQVLIQYLIVIELRESADRFSIAQTAMMLPMLALIMFGGAAADRAELKSHLIRLQLLMAIPPAVLAFVVGIDQLSFAVMIVFGVALACVQSFVQPARDSFLTNVAHRTAGIEIPRAVAAATAVQFLAQLGGFALAGTAGAIGSLPLLILFSALMCLAALFTMNILPAERHGQHGKHAPREPILKQFTGGFSEVFRSDRLRPIVVCMFLMGLFGMGGMMVVIPIVLRDVYHGGSFALSLFQVFFTAGTATTALILSYRRPMRRQGRALMLCMFGGIAAMTVMHFAPPLYVIYPLVFLWGLCGGMWMSMSRAILQESAPPTHRARILAVFSLGMLGGGPVGALISGQLVHMWGPLNAILFPPAGMFVIVVGMFIFTRLWHLERLQPARP